MPEQPNYIYADNAATTPLLQPVLEAMLPYYIENFGNPSAVYKAGRTAKRALEEARERTARCINCLPQEIYFTASGTEADNWAIKGVAHAMAKQGKTQIITSKIEHHAVLHTCAALEKEGFSVIYLDVHENGRVVPEELEAALTDQTALVSIMYANNETGTIQPVSEIGKICRKHGVLFHTDAVQAAGHLPIDVAAQNIDLLSLSAHKFNGPKGIGALYIRQGIFFPNLIDGGTQERGRRAGTENVAGAVGLSVALELACASMAERTARLIPLRDKLTDGLLKIERSRLNGDREHRLPGHISVCFEGIEGESLLLMLDLKGICASSGSACTSGSLDPSHVLLALGIPPEIAHGSLRLSLPDDFTESEADTVLQTVTELVARLRSLSPLWKKTRRG